MTSEIILRFYSFILSNNQINRIFLESDPLRCVPVPDSGPFNCDDQFIKWQYDYNTRQCNEFIWAGCGGNDNRFDSERECLEYCRP